MFLPKEMTAEEFLIFAEQHPDKRFDFIDVEMVEVSPKRQPVRVRRCLSGSSTLICTEAQRVQFCQPQY